MRKTLSVPTCLRDLIAVLGNDIILNVGCVINHDYIVSDHYHITTGTLLAGEVIVGEYFDRTRRRHIRRSENRKNVTVNSGYRIFIVGVDPAGYTVALEVARYVKRPFFLNIKR